jgi:hypothetical protein
MVRMTTVTTPPRQRHHWDGYAAVVASFVGLLALLLSGYTAYLQRQQVRAEIWPNLQIENSTKNLQYYAVNRGMGPARVRGVRVTVGGKLKKRWAEVLRAVGTAGNEGAIFSSINGRVVMPGEKVDLLLPAEGPGARALFQDFLRNARGFAMVICYCSVLDECRLAAYGLDGVDTEQEQESCPFSAAEQFED